MIRILIVEKDLEICKEFINNLNKYVGKLSTFYLASNIREFKAFYNNKETDIILINNNVFNCYKNILEKSKKPYVLFSDINFKEIGEKIIEKNNTFTSIEGKIKRELNYLGYNFKYNGTKYLVDVIYYISKNKEKIPLNLEKNVYPIIANKYSTSSHNIKCNIVNATDNMICECKENILMEYLGYTEYVKPSPKKIIEQILNKILDANTHKGG